MRPLFSCLLLLACATPSQPLPQAAPSTQAPVAVATSPAIASAPVAVKKPYVRDLQGERFTDDYF